MRRICLPVALAGAMILAGCGAKESGPAAHGPLRGSWQVVLDPGLDGAVSAVWTGAKMRIGPDGAFRIYGPIDASGTVRTVDGGASFQFSKLLGQDPQFIKDRAEAFGVLPTGSLDRPMVVSWRNDALVCDPSWPPADGVSWVRLQPRPIAELLDVVSRATDITAESEFAYDEIGSRREESVPVLIDRLKSGPDRDTRYWAAAMLGYIRDPSTLPALVTALDDPIRSVRAAAARALGDLADKRATAPLIAASKSGKLTLFDVAGALAEIKDPAAVPFLIDALGKTQTRLAKSRAAEALGAIGDKRALPALRKLGRINDSSVRAAVAVAVAGMSPKDPLIRDLLPDLVDRLADAEWMEKCDIAEALAKIGDSSAEGALAAVLDDAMAPVRREAATALGSVGSKRILPRLDAVTKGDSDEYVRAAARAAARQIRSRKN